MNPGSKSYSTSSPTPHYLNPGSMSYSTSCPTPHLKEGVYSKKEVAEGNLLGTAHLSPTIGERTHQPPGHLTPRRQKLSPRGKKLTPLGEKINTMGDQPPGTPHTQPPTDHPTMGGKISTLRGKIATSHAPGHPLAAQSPGIRRTALAARWGRKTPLGKEKTPLGKK